MPSPAPLSLVLVLAGALTAQGHDARRGARPPQTPPAAPGAAAPRTAQQEIEGLLAAAARGDAVVFWDWLPDGYQRDVEGLVRELAGKVDEATYDRTWRLVKRVAQVGVQKQEFVFGNTQVAAMLGKDQEQAENAQVVYGALLGLLGTVADSEVGTLAGLRGFDGRLFLKHSGKQVLDTLLTIAALQGNDARQLLRRTTVHTVEQTGDRAKVELRAPGKEPEAEVLVKHEGRWLPDQMVRDWQRTMAQAKARIAALPKAGDAKSTAQARTVLGALEGFVRKFEDVESQADFDEVLAEVLAFAGRGNAQRGAARRAR